VPYIALYQQDLCIALSKGFVVPHFDEPGFMFDDYALQVNGRDRTGPGADDGRGVVAMQRARRHDRT
jgi:hypothetical protein